MEKITPKIDFAIGGQAVIEGVMMRSPRFYTVSVRDPQGKIQMQQKPFKSVISGRKWLNIPLLRGIIHFVESMKLSFRALDYSSQISMDEDPDAELPLWQKILSWGSIAFSIVIMILMMKAIPLWIAEQVSKWVPLVADHYTLFNLVDGLSKLVVFFGYIAAISCLNDMKRTFQYHGAEHKSVWAYEKGLPLTVANARKQSRFHPRCGTSFMFVVVLLSVFIYTLIPPMDGFALKLASRIAVIPLVAGLGLEVVSLSAKYENSLILKVLTWPGLLFQRLSTREPDDEQLAVALNSLKESLKAEEQ